MVINATAYRVNELIICEYIFIADEMQTYPFLRKITTFAASKI
jgi:hypothetical protein